MADGALVPGRIDPGATYTMAAARRLKRVAQGALHRALRGGDLPAARRGNAWAIRGADLVAWEPPSRAAWAGRLTVPRAAREAGVGADTVRGAIRAGALPAVRAEGGRWRIDRADLAAWAGERPAPAGPLAPGALYRPAHAARLAGVSKQAMHQAIRAGRVEAVETEDGKRVRGADVVAWRQSGSRRRPEGKT